jgi:flavin-dependent dehydrogenase
MDRDIIIIGGGPSGLSTALHLQRIAPRLAPRVLILEKAHYPRFKLCAGGLVLDAEIILQRLGLDTSEVPHVDTNQIHFDFAGRGLNIRVPHRHALRVIRRDEFDNWLAGKTRASGIEIREGVTVKNIIPESGHIIVETSQGNFRAQVVVGADGSNGVTRRCIFPRAPVYTARVLEVITPSLPPPNSLNLGEVPAAGRWGSAFFDFFPIPENIAGYVWDFPTQIKGQSMRCWGIYDTNILADEKRPPLKEPLAQEMSRFGFNLDEYEIKGHPIRWFSPENPMSAPRILLVGDAVGADPIFGEGISIALGYGNLAAHAIKDAFQRNDLSFRSYKRHVVFSPLGWTLFARWFITHIIYPLKWKWFQVLLWRIWKPIVIAVAWIFVLNWGKRMPRPTP